MASDIEQSRLARVPQIVAALRAFGYYERHPARERILKIQATRMARHGALRDDVDDLIAYAKRTAASPQALFAHWIREWLWEPKLVEARCFGIGKLLYKEQNQKPLPEVLRLMEIMHSQLRRKRSASRSDPCWKVLQFYRAGTSIADIAVKCGMAPERVSEELQIALRSGKRDAPVTGRDLAGGYNADAG